MEGGGGAYKMKLEVIENNKTDNILTFILKDSSVAFANVLRKNIIAKVPTMAIEEVDFKKNSSVLYDEIIAHRLGLLPLTTDLKSYVLPEKCKCKGAGCARCQLKLTLNVKTPGIIEASKIKSQDPKIKPVYPETPIVKLLDGQALQFEATAILGKGEQHSKWSPGHAYYKHVPILTIKKNPKDAEAIVKSCPQKIFELDKNNNLKINKERVMLCHACEACADVSNGAVELGREENSFIFTVESWGQISCREMVIQAIDVLIEELNELEMLLKQK